MLVSLRTSSSGLSGGGEGGGKEGELATTARFTLKKIFGTARVKMARVPKKGFGSNKICSVNNLSVPNFIRAEQKFLPVLGPSGASSPSTDENGTGAEKNGTEQVVQTL